MLTVLNLVLSHGPGGTQHSNVGCLPSPSLVALLMICILLLKSFVSFLFFAFLNWKVKSTESC